ncbi:efflux RND transporter periplasmic adaptor subunit [Azospirillum sp. RWY-5-1]|uniref:Efflux RND transporter periplasmic adaptor subunit n=1 Tax=Azospirillum oleiclasticum TaxID=2735135 RepID=A0ABX2TB73_9PROT|nr:efflux RND transporter periplasmic adaptor subunit [Azospirillum oleiclasticum]NYZ14112.1 efflux RND transporter periplasmic adaptor subunit [Azospirillum oleiclasticum]NYZ21596.1 efflux RND transporter periplasmic adaptor subunit [Azospirillum oleiclasticum]
MGATLGALAVTFVAALWPAGAALAQGAPGGAPPPVTVAQPLRQEIVEWDEFTGQFSAIDFVEIRARVSGYLESIHFTDGQLVKKGDLLFVIDPRPFEATLASAQAEQAQAQARLDLAQRQLARASELRRGDNISASVFDERQQEVRVAAAGVEVAKASVRTAELNLGYTRISAPIAGRISRRAISVGNLVAAGEGAQAAALTTIVSLDPIYFDFDMSERDFLAYQRAIKDGRISFQRNNGNGNADGVPVEGRLFDEPSNRWSLKGQLNFIDNRVNSGSGTIRVRALYPNPDLFLTPGQFGRLRLPGSERYTATLIPDTAVISDQASKIVMTVKEDGTVVPKPVRLGPIENGLRVVRAGLEPTDRVIITGIVRARPGAKVTPQPGKIEPPAQPN